MNTMTPNNEIPVITIDGPSGTGKGTISHLLAKYLKWHFLDSGAMYRVLAYAIRTKELSFSDISALTQTALNLQLVFKEQGGVSQTWFEGQDISEKIRTEQCGKDASVIAMIPEVRDALLQRQRNFRVKPGLVTDGRDMGTVVFPNATLKLYLTATSEERASRRFKQLQQKQINVTLQQVIDELNLRDERDSQRAIAPLKPAQDAKILDTTGLSIDQVLQNVLQLVGEAGIS